MRMRQTAMAAAVAAALSFSPAPVSASYYQSLNSLFTMLILEPGESFDDEGVTKTASDVWTGKFNANMTSALDYWTTVLGDNLSASKPVTIRVIPLSTANRNAAAYSPSVGDGSVYNDYTQLTAALVYDYYGPGGTDYSAYVADIQVNHGWWYRDEYGWLDWDLGTVGSLPSAGTNTSLTPMLIHEVCHALGLLTTREMTTVTTDGGGYYNKDFQLLYDGGLSKGLYDVYDNKLTAASKIVLYNEVPDDGGNYFAVYSMKSMYYDDDGSVSGAYFRGEHTDEVLNGAWVDWPDLEGSLKVPGIPINGFDPDDNGIYYPDFSHLELKNGLMSHQSYRNYTVLMEAELAVMQDLGVKIDRRNHYGYSVYNSGEATYDEDGNVVSFTRRQFTNTNPYYGRADGQWLWGTYNPTAYGIGLHIYGSYNDITQAADILNSGAYGVGIRVDGSGNAVTVGKGTQVSADGLGGIGLLVSYGKGHEINVQGVVTARGQGGNAVEFNFGDNFLGNGYYVAKYDRDGNLYYDRHGEYRGSYIYCDLQFDNVTKFDDRVYGLTGPYLLPELEGALVDTFTISGTIVGAENAVYIARNAYVKNINLLNGARVSGNIASDWDYASGLICGGYTFKDTGGHALLTNLNFGVDADGNADPGFAINFDGNITGQNSLVVSFKGGQTFLGLNAVSTVTAMAVQIDEGATLATGSSFKLDGYTDFSTFTNDDGTPVQVAADSEFAAVSFGTLLNNGTIAVSGSGVRTLSVEGNFAQGASGILAMRFNQSANDILAVTGSLTLTGTVSLSAGQDYYPSAFSRTVRVADLLASEALDVSSDLRLAYTYSDSPTLTETVTLVNDTGASFRAANASSAENSSWTVRFGRTAEAYSRYSSGDANSAAVGLALDELASAAPASLQTAVAALDFSASDGSDITAALDSLNPAAFSIAVNGVLSHQRFLNDLGLDRMQRVMIAAPGDYVYADPYVAGGRRGSGLYLADREYNFGVVAGMDRVEAGMLSGVYLNLNARSQKTKGRVNIRDTSFYAGLHGALSLTGSPVVKLFGDGRIGADFVE